MGIRILGLRGLWHNCKYWFVIIAIIGLLTIYTFWYLYFEPQHIPLFLATTIVALSFVTVMALLPKYRQRFVERILAYHAKEKKLGALYRYQKVALVSIIINTLIFSIIWRYQIIPTQYMPFYVLTFLIVVLASGTILTVGMLRTAGKWGVLLIAILTIIVVLRLLIWRYLAS